MILYRPHRGSLSASIKDEQMFNSIEEMKQFIHDEWCRICNFIGNKEPFSIDDIVVSEIIGDDPRIAWKNVRHVCVKRMWNENYIEKYSTPQCIGYCGESSISTTPSLPPSEPKLIDFPCL